MLIVEPLALLQVDLEAADLTALGFPRDAREARYMPRLLTLVATPCRCARKGIAGLAKVLLISHEPRKGRQTLFPYQAYTVVAAYHHVIVSSAAFRLAPIMATFGTRPAWHA